MKLFLALGVLVGAYVYVMLHTTDVVLNQTQHLHAQYQAAADQAEQLANGL